MGRLSDWTEARIKAAARIEDVVGDFVELRKQGPRYWGLCPFHEDNHIGNFNVLPSRNLCKCFACGVTYDPIAFLMNYGKGMTYGEALRWLANKYGIRTDDSGEVKMVEPIKREVPKLEPFYLDLPEKALRVGDYDRNPLARYIYNLPWEEAQRASVTFWLKEYRVGTSMAERTKGWTIWWLTDEEGRLLTGKMMKYGEDGHRDRKSNYSFDFIHSLMERRGRISLKGKEVGKCLFGLHLMDRYPDDTICIVESEKSAVICQILCGVEGGRLFMATGGKGRLTKELLQPLMRKNRKIVLYPDVDALDEWGKFVRTCGYLQMRISNNVIQQCDAMREGGHQDISDILVEDMRKRKELRDAEEREEEK